MIKERSQKYEINYIETFPSVVHNESVRTILSISLNENLKLKRFDIKTVKSVYEIYMVQPIGYEDNNNRVCKLKKSLYRLK